jgi:hypothetical protein
MRFRKLVESGGIGHRCGGGLTNVAADNRAKDGARLRRALLLNRSQLNSVVSQKGASKKAEGGGSEGHRLLRYTIGGSLT